MNHAIAETIQLEVHIRKVHTYSFVAIQSQNEPIVHTIYKYGTRNHEGATQLEEKFKPTQRRPTYDAQRLIHFSFNNEIILFHCE